MSAMSRSVARAMRDLQGRTPSGGGPFGRSLGRGVSARASSRPPTPGLASTRRVAEHDGEEPVGAQRPQPEVGAGPPPSPSGGCGAAGRSRRSPPPGQGRDHPAVADDLGLTGLDHVVAVADVALRKTTLPAGTSTGSRPRASCSTGGSGRVLSMGTPAAARRPRRARRRCGRVARSRRHDAAASTGHSSRRRPGRDVRRPGRPPRGDDAPIPMDTATRLSSTPKTRASTSSGASRPAA